MFKTTMSVRMYDTDAAGILYFGSQFRFAHDAFESLLQSEGVSFADLLEKEDFMFVIVHAEADYKSSLKVGDVIDVRTYISRIGDTSFVVEYSILRQGETVGRVQTVHVCIDKETRSKKAIPEKVRVFLKKYYWS